MQFLLIFLCVLTSTAQTVFRKNYSLKTNGGAFLFSCMITLVAMLFFVFTSGGLHFNMAILPHSAGFGLCYALATITMFLAIASGPLAMTSLISSYSLIIPTIYGIVFLHEPLGVYRVLGILLSMISLLFVGKKEPATSTQAITPKWVFFITVGTLANGMCSVTQKAQQNAFSGEFKSEFMIIALLFAGLMLLAVSLVCERKQFVQTIKLGATGAFFCGICNGATNLLVMVITGMMAASVFFPMLSAGMIISSCLLSVLLYRENLAKRQYLSVVLGILALILLNS